MNKNFIKYLEELIAFKSVTPDSNGAIEYIADLLKASGFIVVIKDFGEKYKVKNLYASYGEGRHNICFGGHVDVVPAGDLSQWISDPFKATKNENKIFGRGTVDMKGAIACMLSAALDFIKSNPIIEGQISFLLTSDEEGEARYGTKAMLEYLKEQNILIDLVILGEPTCKNVVGDTVKIGRRGSINFILDIIGKQGHVAYPHEADNPLPYLIDIMQDLVKTPLDTGNEYFQKSNLEITSIDVCNETTNIIPAKATAKFNIRFNDIHTSESLISLINKRIENYTNLYKLTANISAEAFIQKPDNLIIEFFEVVRDITNIDTEFSTDGGTSDARFIKDYCQTVEFGLLHNMAHKINEYTQINDLQRLHDVYYNSLNKFLK
jgi:succinyl-diaminopimelate desuccinylase